MNASFFQDLLGSIAERGRALIERSGGRTRPGWRRRRRAARDPRGPVPRPPLRPRRGIGRGPRPPGARPLWPLANRGPPRLLPLARARLRPRPGPTPGRLGRLRRGADPIPPPGAPARRRAAATGAVPPAQSCARRHRGARPDAPGSPDAGRRRSGPRERGRRPRPPPLLLVQPRLPGAAPHRLVDAGRHPRADHPLRGRARDPGLGRPASPRTTLRPPLLRLLPPVAGRRAADLRRGGADPRDPELDPDAACGGARRAACDRSRRRRSSTRSATASRACAVSRSAIS